MEAEVTGDSLGSVDGDATVPIGLGESLDEQRPRNPLGVSRAPEQPEPPAFERKIGEVARWLGDTFSNQTSLARLDWAILCFGIYWLVSFFYVPSDTSLIEGGGIVVGVIVIATSARKQFGHGLVGLGAFVGLVASFEIAVRDGIGLTLLVMAVVEAFIFVRHSSRTGVGQSLVLRIAPRGSGD